jgi:hypothetical protein
MGGSVPYILRPIDDYYQLIGDAYVHGVMDGEAWLESRIQEIILE